ncbi:spermidine synthase [Cohnella sp. CFH 77786]|uniref:spermine/spermidine synthase domain-containing protein n=1 Tax=Cohnella sp. CFH 77786 TaxID=2662265 RepID=UPI001C60E204|nr:spermidine synthase [Cohnella sp. CFH 77786]
MASSSKSGNGSLREYVSKEDEPDGKYRVVKRIKTPVQRIAVVETEKGETLIYGDGYVMFGTTKDDELWAESLVHIPMAAAANRGSVLLIGGGGGILAREALRYPDVKRITAVDADRIMMNLGKSLKSLVKFNQGALNNPKVTTIVKDGRAMVEGSRQKWDVIVVDVPEPSEDVPQLRRLFSVNFYRLLKERLQPGGAIAVACTCLNAEMPEFSGSIIKTIKAAGLYVLPYHMDVRKSYGQDWAYCLASNRPLSSSGVKLRIKPRYLTESKLKGMFVIPNRYRKKWKKGKIQTDRNHVLRDIHEEH